MAIKYLLKCRCGKKVPVVSSQADQVVSCSCGLELQVPTLLKLRQLESIEEASSRMDAPSNWGVAQGLMTISIVMLLASSGWLIYVMTQTKPPTLKEIRTDEIIEKVVENQNLVGTFELWKFLRNGLEKQRSIDKGYEYAKKAYDVRFGVALTLFILAIGLTVISLIFARRSSSRAKRNTLGDH